MRPGRVYSCLGDIQVCRVVVARTVSELTHKYTSAGWVMFVTRVPRMCRTPCSSHFFPESNHCASNYAPELARTEIGGGTGDEPVVGVECPGWRCSLRGDTRGGGRCRDAKRSPPAGGASSTNTGSARRRLIRMTNACSAVPAASDLHARRAGRPSRTASNDLSGGSGCRRFGPTGRCVLSRLRGGSSSCR
jgi:hypothetical protein